MAGKKISQFTVVTTALTSAYVTLVQTGANVIITMANFLKNYYDRDEIDAIVDAIVVGGLTFQKVVLDRQSILASTSKVFTHNIGNSDFTYEMLEYDTGLEKYIKMQTPLSEANRSNTTVTLYSTVAITDFKIIFLG